MEKETKFKQTEIGLMPEDWDFDELTNHAKIIAGQSPESTYYNSLGEGMPFLQGIKTFGNLYPTYDTWTTRITKLAKKDSVLLSVRAPVGEVNIADKDICIGRGLMSIEGEDNRFIYYLFKAFNDYVINKEKGTVYGSITLEDVKRIKFPFSPLTEQRAIAKILSDLDEKIELNQKMNKTLEAIGQAIFKHWFVDFEFPNDEGKPYKSSGGEMVYNEELGKEIPKGWRVSKIGDELKTTLGGTPSTNKKEYWEHGNIPWINSGAINDFPIINASQHITEAGLNNSATQLMPKKTVVLPFVVSINKYIRISITGIETSGNQSVLGIVENKKIHCEFIYYWIEKMKDNIYSWATGGAQQHINKNNVDNTPILIPTNNVMNNFKKLLIPIFDKILNNSYEIQTLSQLRDSLLPKLMSGKIRVPLEGKE
jgi:type I restriction enzyme S subunit